MKLTERQEDLYADKLMDLGNYALTALVFGQAFGAAKSLAIGLVGFVFYAGCLVLSFWFQKGGD